jgi:hypothetical protein
MEFDPIPPEEIDEYLSKARHVGYALSVILTDGTTLTGRSNATRSRADQSIVLSVEERNGSSRVVIPVDRVAGIAEQVLPEVDGGVQPPDPALLVPAAEKAGLEVRRLSHIGGLHPGSTWEQGRIHYQEDTWLYLDSNAISLRSGGINSIGFGIPIASASIGWQSKLFNKARGFLGNHVVDVGSHCAAPHADLALNGYVQFFDVSGYPPSSDVGPLLELEGSLWTAAVVRPSPRGTRSADDPWALCYFRQECMMLGWGSWENMLQPVRIYGDKQPQVQTLDMGVAYCYLKARAAMCFGSPPPPKYVPRPRPTITLPPER